MSEYYAVERTGSELAHYGVRGMRWGVKKALNAKSQKRRDRLMRKVAIKAENKLRKLNDNADLARQKAAAKSNTKKALRSGVTSAALAALNYGANNQYQKSVSDNIRSRKFTGVEIGKGRNRVVIPTNRNSLAWLGAAGASAVGSNIGLTKATYHAGKAIAAASRSSKRGHAKAVAKRDAFKREIDKAFKDTKYASQISSGSNSSTSKPKTKKRRNSVRA